MKISFIYDLYLLRCYYCHLLKPTLRCMCIAKTCKSCNRVVNIFPVCFICNISAITVIRTSVDSRDSIRFAKNRSEHFCVQVQLVLQNDPTQQNNSSLKRATPIHFLHFYVVFWRLDNNCQQT